MSEELTYRTHILSVPEHEVMTVIANWRHLPKQAEVLEEIHKARDGHTTFAHCTPASIFAG